MGEDQVVALNRINLDVPEGDYVAIMGPSGSGKELIARKIHKQSKRKLKPFGSNTNAKRTSVKATTAKKLKE